MDLSHDFVKPRITFLYRYKKCMFCKRINIFKAVFKCKDCTKVCHRKCHTKFVEMELKRKEELEMCVDVTPSDTPGTQKQYSLIHNEIKQNKKFCPKII